MCRPEDDEVFQQPCPSTHPDEENDKFKLKIGYTL
jgi:hypothetical protein